MFSVCTLFWLGRYTRNSTSIQLSCLLLCSIIVILGVTSFSCLFKYLEIYIDKINYFQFISQVLSNFRKLLWIYVDELFESITLLWLRNYLVNCDFKRHVLFDGTSIFFFSLQIFIRAIWKSANHPCYLPMPRYLPTFILPIRLRFAIMHSADTNSKSKIVQ